MRAACALLAACSITADYSGLQVSPTVLASAQDQPMYLALDAAHATLYWSNADNPGAIMRAPTSGGAAAPIATTQNQPFGVAVDASAVYWVNNGDGKLLSCALAGDCATPKLLTDMTSQGHGLVVDDAVYLVDQSGMPQSRVLKVDKNGGAPAVLASGRAFSLSIAVDRDNVYWTDSGGSVSSIPKTGGSMVFSLAGMQSGPHGIAIDAASVYFTDSDGGAVMRVAKSGSGGVTALATGQKQPEGIAIDEAFVYWVNSGDGTVMRCPLNGGATPTRLALGQGRPFAIAVDASSVYWTDPQRGTVMKLAKP